MKSVFITTITGPDSAGIIKLVAEATRSLDGEWIASKVMKLGGHFAAIMKVSIGAANEFKLKSLFDEQFPQLTFTHAEVSSQTDKPSQIVTFVIDCNDRAGLTREINDVLVDLNLVAENMECNRVHVSSIGAAVFTARLSMAVPQDMDSEALGGEIEALIDGVRVNVISS